jgi:hypothetical protein
MFPPDRFHCLLDELPLHLVPRRQFSALRSQFDPRQNLCLNPQMTILPPGQIPDELISSQEALENFALPGAIAWVRDLASGSLSPFWLGPKLENAVASIEREGRLPAALSGDEIFLLAASGILVARDQEDRRRGQRHDTFGKIREMFLARGYAPSAGLIHPFHLAALRRYYRHMIRRGTIQLGDEQSSRRYVAHNDSVARFFHHQLANTISSIAGEPVKPSYVYSASYLGGAELKKHIDRGQCEFSVTLCLDFSPEPRRETPWPIHLDTPKGKVTVFQALGDGLVYRGTQVPHYRDVLPEGQTSTSIFFHYVAANFEGTLT